MTLGKLDKDATKGPVRSGGRAARRAVRSAPLDSAIRPIKPGLPGGNFNPLERNKGADKRRSDTWK